MQVIVLAVIMEEGLGRRALGLAQWRAVLAELQTEGPHYLDIKGPMMCVY